MIFETRQKRAEVVPAAAEPCAKVLGVTADAKRDDAIGFGRRSAKGVEPMCLANNLAKELRL